MVYLSTLRTTTITYRTGSKTSIYTFYNSGTFAFIADAPGYLLGNRYIEGQLVFQIEEFPNVDFYLNGDGELLVSAPDANKYFIDGDGNLNKAQ